jgi:hypothetical protein
VVVFFVLDGSRKIVVGARRPAALPPGRQDLLLDAGLGPAAGARQGRCPGQQQQQQQQQQQR